MIHYTCDRCKRTINPENELRYVVRLEVYASLDPIEDELHDEPVNKCPECGTAI